MRLGHCCHDTFPSSDTNTQQIFWTAFELARLGVEVEIVVPALTARTFGAVGAYYGADQLPPELSIVAHGGSTAADWATKGWFDWRMGPYLATRGYDLVWTRDPLAAMSCARRGLPFVFETYRPDFATARRFALWRRVCLGASSLRAIITHSHVAANAFVAAGLPPERCLVAHNGFAPSLMTPPMDRAGARAALGLPADGPLVVYSGHVGPEKGIETLIRLAAAVPSMRLLIVGVGTSSSETGWIERVARDAGAQNVLMRPRVPLVEVSTYLYAADCLIVPPTSGPFLMGGTVLPMKIFSYLAAGRPILAPRLPDVEEVLVDGENAVLVTPTADAAGQDVSAVGAAARALSALLADRPLQDRLAANALATAVEFTWEVRAKRVLAFLEGAAGRPTPGREAPDGVFRPLASAPPPPPQPAPARISRT